MRRKLSPAVLLLPIAMLALMPETAFAKGKSGGNDRTSFGSDITISDGETVGDIACAFCSVHLRGDVTGDVAVAFGSVTVEPGRTISGDTAILEGNLNLAEGAKVNGDLAILAGSDRLAEGAVVQGSRAVVQQPIGTLILFSPLLVLAAIIWLIVYLVRRNRYRFPVYPQGQGVYPPPPPRR